VVLALMTLIAIGSYGFLTRSLAGSGRRASQFGSSFVIFA
jgi:hypothetical protein